MRTSKHLIATASFIAAFAPAAPALAGAPKPVVLGNASSISQATGWGTAAPRVISGAGARITQIHWRNWGSATATGWGMTSLPKQSGGNYPGLYRVQLRASRIAWDAGEHARAYMVLQAREPLAPGSSLSPWFQWVGQTEMCN